MASTDNNPPGFFARLKQHHIYRVVTMYAIAAWVLMQLANSLFPDLGWPRQSVLILIVAVALLFPVVLVLSWMLIPPSKENPAKFSRWQHLRWRLGSVLTLVIVVLVMLSGAYLWHARTRHLKTEEIAAAKVPAVTPAPLATTIPAQSVAVLPFVNESNNKSQQYFSDGLSEDLITALSQFAGLTVIGRDSSFRFRSKDSSRVIGAKLGVAYLLVGSVQRAGDEVRISAELINAADGQTLWAQHYDRPYKDLFKLQDDITTAVASALKFKLLPGRSIASQSDRPPSGNLIAYNDLLQGHFYGSNFTLADLREAIGFYDRAIALDPHYADAYAALTFAQINLGRRITGAEQQQAYAKARNASATALALAPDLGAVHSAHAYLLRSLDGDAMGALVEFRRALALDPHSADAMSNLAHDLAGVGQLDAAAAMFRKAIAADPLRYITYTNLSYSLAALGHLDEAEQTARQGVELRPTSSFAQETLATIELLRGNTAAVLQWADKEPTPDQKLWFQAAAYTVAGDHAKADVALKAYVAKYASEEPYSTAQLYALRKQPDQMFLWLDRARTARDPSIDLLNDAIVLPYQNDPRFVALCKKMSLPAPGEKLPDVAPASSLPAVAATTASLTTATPAAGRTL